MTSCVGRAIGKSGRLLMIVALISLISTACGNGAAETPTTLEPPTSATLATTQPSMTTPAPTSTTQPPATTDLGGIASVANLGAGAIAPLAGSDGMLGSGCTPASDTLQDGAWFGWVHELDEGEFQFDLACVHPDDPPLVTNDSAKLRQVLCSPDAVVHFADGTTQPVDEWAPTDDPVWIYLVWGITYEIAYPTVEFEMASAAAWTEADVALPVGGGCCGEMHHGPASPNVPWPAEGLPADGVYPVDMTIDVAAGDLMLVIMRFVPCDERPDLCVPDYLPGDVTVDNAGAIARRVPLDAEVTVRIRGLGMVDLEPTGALGIEGSGVAFGVLLGDMETAWDAYVQPEIAAGADLSTLMQDLKARGAADPAFPYGPSAMMEDDWAPLVYRGPLGLEIVEWLDGFPGYLGPTQLEVVDGRPVITIDAGRIAG